MVTVEAAGLNPVDMAIASGAFAGPVDMPCVAGREGIGIDATGRRVYFDTTVVPFGSFAEKTLVPRDLMIDVPDGIESASALPFGIAGMAAWLGLAWKGRMLHGESVLVLGASSIVGQVAVQAASILGAGRVVAAARDEVRLSQALNRGADVAVRITSDGDFPDELLEASCDGFDLVIDPLGGEPAAAALGAMAEHGRLVQIGSAAGPTVELTARPFRLKSLSILGLINFSVPIEIRAEAFRRMCDHASKGQLTVDVEEFGLESVGSAWSRQAGGPHHKLVIRP
ncbi:MAG: zinc-binding alcohol dehydrogenase family protein [Actinomycetota bacterium]|nr:zinc-binding alcohol dehydrogenase family protein [Actinomycetota bacterium]